ncbi:diaminobutyrate acetyltransferase [Mycolicibacterium flavescens]|uniref:L-2,4-diaminobutyric acid acetyltransferase n=1 Tax=Mycolicibacterium flavescens TaxID=1776 RepID=A0A1E3R8B0_MYCFV|nr:diaminobutyrate acetyltransferase [Mycolicibacterium flavescens]
MRVPELGKPGLQTPDFRLRRPQASDALAMHRVAEATQALDVNSTYAYLLWATDFADTSIVAEADGDLVGFITGHHPPPRPEALFVWQVAVSPAAQGRGLGSAMLDGLLARVLTERPGQAVTVEATVAPGNAQSRALFGGFARRHGVPLVEDEHFTADLLAADGGHEDEPIFRIGPITEPLN